MAVTLSSPTNRVVPRGSTRFSWTTTYPQSAYEIQYRPVGSTSWSTFGRVTSTAKTVDQDVSRLIDFNEYHFRIVVYAADSTSGTTIYNGNEKSAVYSIIVSPPKQLAKLRAKYGSKMLEVPIYESSNNPEAVRVSLGNAYGSMPAVPPSETAATDARFEHPKGIKALSNATSPQFTDGKIPAETYMQIDTQNTHYRYYYRYAYDTYYVGYYLSSYSTRYSTQNLGNYVTGYGSKYDKTYYRGYYLSGTTTKYDKTYYKGSTSNYSWKYDKTYTRGYTAYYRWVYVWYAFTIYRSDAITGSNCSSFPCTYTYYGGMQGNTLAAVKNNGYYYFYNANVDLLEQIPCYMTTRYRGYERWIQQITYYKTFSNGTFEMGAPVSEIVSTAYYGYYGYKYVSSYTRYYGYYAYTSSAYSRYYGYYRYYCANYSAYYGYYKYYQSNYSRYYSYYRYTTTYKQTYYSYSRNYRYV